MKRRTLLAALATPGLALAQEPVLRIIIPFPPGGPADTIARLLERPLRASLGQAVVLDYRSGAGGVVGMEAVARARPDGHTVGLGSTGALVIAPHIMPRMPYDPLRDLAAVSEVLAVPQLLAVPTAFPARDVAALVAMARAAPGSIAYASAGIGSSLHLAAELFRQKAGITITHVPYRGAAPAITDLVAGRVQMMLGDVTGLLPQVQGGALRALGITAAARFSGLPDVPTIAEAGIEGVISDTFYGVLAPAGVPAGRLSALAAALRAALAEPDTRAALAGQGGNIIGSTPEDFATRLRVSSARWAEVVQAGQIRME
ncbi:Bug family tripartite tricarboxylate transporter substrate binding protein [Rhodovarius sp.]|uniref:Bug family tripartite tricarboxylate transporter substrate binding protein n=1 Tax=Rhodovarius sp. TaxID=2972673 RepID=UPI0034A3764A